MGSDAPIPMERLGIGKLPTSPPSWTQNLRLTMHSSVNLTTITLRYLVRKWKKMDAKELEKLSPEQLMELAAKLGLGGVQADDADSTLVTPNPGFVIKTHQLDPTKSGSRLGISQANGQKVFVNVCTSDSVATFRTVKRFKEGSTTEQEEGIHIPVAVGPLIDSTDKKGEKCKVCDVIMHPDVINDVEKDLSGSFRHFVVELALQYVEKKYNMSVSHQYKLPVMRYKGDTVLSQRIRKKAAVAGISEVKSTTADASPLSLLAQTGAISQPAVPYDPAAAKRSAPTRAAPVPVTTSTKQSVPLDIRVLNPSAGDVKAEISKEVASSGGDSVNAPSLTKLGSAASNAGSEDLLVARETVRKPKQKPQLPAIPLAISVAMRLPNSSDGIDTATPSFIQLPIIEETLKGIHKITVQLPTQAVHAPLTTIAEENEDADEEEAVEAVPTSMQGIPPYNQPYTSLAEHCDALLLSAACRQVCDASSAPLLPALEASHVRVTVSKTGTIVRIDIQSYAPTEIFLPFAFTANAIPGVGLGLTPVKLFPLQRIVQVLLARDKVMQKQQSLPALPANLRESLDGVADANTNIPRPMLLSMLRQYVDANANDYMPDVGSKQWLIAHAIATEDDETSTPTTTPAVKAAAVDAKQDATADEELPEDRFLREDALSMHYLRMRSEDKAKREQAASDKEKQQQQLYTIDASLYTQPPVAVPTSAAAVVSDSSAPALSAAKDLHVFDLM